MDTPASPEGSGGATSAPTADGPRDPVPATASGVEPQGSGGTVAEGPPRGLLRVYLGSTPGSGKTYAMLREGRDRRAEGQDVVVGFVETHGRPRTEAALEGLEVMPRRCQEFRGQPCEDMDLDAVVARHPQVALVDELAHTNLPGSRHERRWQDVEELLANGIDVLTTVNIQAIESVKDLVENITGIPVRETVPDRVLDTAQEIQFIDISPQALRKRMRHGNIYAPDKVDIALSNFFREGNLSALREIALRMLAQTVGRTAGKITGTPQDVLVTVSGRPSSEGLIRRGARMARRFGGFCTVLRVVEPGEDESPEIVERCRSIAEELQCTWREVEGRSIDEAVVAAAHELGAQHLLIGETSPTGLLGRFRKSLVDRLVSELPDVSLHVIARDPGSRRHHAARPAQATAPEEGVPPPRLTRSGTLRLYLGYAHGCGVTTSMLDEARRRKARGADVVLASVGTHDRARGGATIEGLELLGGPDGAGAHGRLDVDALLQRSPAVACVDELAQPGTDGRPAASGLGRLLDAGMQLVATLHLSDLASVRDALGDRLAPRPEGMPAITDEVLGLAGEVELVDVTTSELLERLRAGEIVPPDQVEAALAGDFAPATLAQLREMAFRIIAEHTDRRLVAYMRERSIEQPWEVRPRVMTCVPARPGMEWLVRRSAALARAIDGDLHVVTVRDRQRTEEEAQTVAGYASLTTELGGDFVSLDAQNVAQALADYARQSLATEVILTRGDKPGMHRSTLRELIRTLGDVDIHVLSTAES